MDQILIYMIKYLQYYAFFSNSFIKSFILTFFYDNMIAGSDAFYPRQRNGVRVGSSLLDNQFESSSINKHGGQSSRLNDNEAVTRSCSWIWQKDERGQRWLSAHLLTPVLYFHWSLSRSPAQKDKQMKHWLALTTRKSPFDEYYWILVKEPLINSCWYQNCLRSTHSPINWSPL